MCTREFCSGKSSALERSVTEVGLFEVGVLEIGVPHLRADERCLLPVNALEVRSAEGGTIEPHASQRGPSKI
jgi:hypothetical protein